MTTPKYILIVGLSSGRGGMESYILSIYRNCDREKMQFHFLSYDDICPEYVQEINQLGGKIFKFPKKRDGVLNQKKCLKELFEAVSYTAVYYQCNRKLQTAIVFEYAKKFHVPLRAIHSHNSTGEAINILGRIREKITDCKLRKCVNLRLACSKEAGEWMFGESSFRVIPNAVNTEVFYYDEVKRERMRETLKMNNKIILGTVGRLAPQKNPLFLVDIMKEIRKRDDRVEFLHLGDGDLHSEMQAAVSEAGLEAVYHLLGNQTAVADYLNAMDVFLLPSRYEGFPIVLVEAQSTGIKCVVAGNITRSCDLTGNVEFIADESESAVWADHILNNLDYVRKDNSQKIEELGYGIKSLAEIIQNIFCEEREPS